MSVSEGNSDLAASTATYGWLNSSGSVYGFINPFQDSDWYVTYLVAGVRYVFQMQGSTLDSYLFLRNGSGALLSSANVSGAGGVETLVYTPTVSGRYYVDAQSNWASFYSQGFYVVWLSSNATDDYAASTFTTSRLAPGQPRGGVLEIAADADWHRVELVAGHSYAFALSGVQANAYLKLFDSVGVETDAAGTGRFNYTATTSGSYYVEVSGNDLTDTGAYTLTQRELPVISVGNAYASEGDSGNTALNFQLKLSAVSPVDVSVQVSTSGNTAVAGTDYVAVNRTVVIPAGSLTATVTVNAIGNTGFQPDRVFELKLSSPVNASTAGGAVGVIFDDDTPASLHLPSDELMGLQWYLYQVRATWAWELASGKGVKVGVFDQGVDGSNPDLMANAGLALGVNAAGLGAGGRPVTAGDNHGTMVAGVIAAARDGQGLVGTAYGASVVPIYSSLSGGPQYLSEIASAFSFAQGLDVLNNSWGFGNQLKAGTNWAFYDNSNDPAFAADFAALKQLAALGRHGLGTVVVQSAGNSYSYGDDTNLHNFQNSRYIVTVGATDYFGHASSFSTTGASILVSAPGGDGDGSYASILTTDRSGAAGNSGSDITYVDGTSFSAPIVSGVVALMLEANPRLGYRDVQEILAYTAHKIDIDEGSWDTNGASNWNGGGLHYNSLTHATGFGQVDALAAVRLAAGWSTPSQTSTNVREVTASRQVNAVIPDNSLTGVFSSIVVSEPLKVERVDVSINILHPYIGDLSILLSSPSGTISFLLWRPAQGALSSFGSSQDDIHFTFDTVLDWGESSVGSWGLSVYDNDPGSVGRLVDWKLTLIGKPETADDFYVYTNEYPDLVASDPARGVLRDMDGGKNTLNAAALGLDCVIDLSGRTSTMLNGAKLSLAAGTSITTAISGDGNDLLTASDAGSVLRGMRGNDTLNGGLGIDTAVYGASRAAASVKPSGTGWTVSSSLDGSDTLKGIERLQFADQSLALDLNGHAGSVARILGAVFGKASVQNTAYAGIGLHYIDGGMAYADLMKLALDVRLGAGASHAAVVELLYTNVVGSAPPAADRDFYVGLLDQHSYTPASLGVMAAETELNAASIQLAGLVQTGLAYTPFTG